MCAQEFTTKFTKNQGNSLEEEWSSLSDHLQRGLATNSIYKLLNLNLRTNLLNDQQAHLRGYIFLESVNQIIFKKHSMLMARILKSKQVRHCILDSNFRNQQQHDPYNGTLVDNKKTWVMYHKKKSHIWLLNDE